MSDKNGVLKYTINRDKIIQAFPKMKDVIAYQLAANTSDFIGMAVYFAKVVDFENWPYEGRPENPKAWEELSPAEYFAINTEVSTLIVAMFRESGNTNR